LADVARRIAGRGFLGGCIRDFTRRIFSTWLAGFVVGFQRRLLDIGTLADLSNIGTLFAFALVGAGVLILRYREPDRPRAFRAPGDRLRRVTMYHMRAADGGLPIMNWIRSSAGWQLDW